MKKFMSLMVVFMLMMVAAPFASGEAVQIWKCEMEDGVTEDQVRTMAANWIEAAAKVPGGEQLKGYVYFPVAVNATGEMDLMFVIFAPSFEEWGKFWDNYAGSDAAEAENAHLEWIICPDSGVWEVFEVE